MNPDRMKNLKLFTVETARPAGLRSVIVRRERKAAVIKQMQEAREMMAFAGKAIVAVAAKPDDFVDRRLVRVRRQLQRLDRQLDDALEAEPLDGRLLNDLAAAQSRLADQEQRLAGRPLPGSRRPGKERQRRVDTSIEPLD